MRLPTWTQVTVPRTGRPLIGRALAPHHLLQFQGVAVRVGQRRASDTAPEVLDLADLYASADKFGTSFGDVIHNQVQTPHAARLSCVHIQPGPEANRAVGALWGQLDNPDALAGLHVNVLDESELA